MLRSTATVLVFAALTMILAGCAALGFVASSIPKSVDAEYKGLAKQKVCVMVWADRGIRIDYPNLQLDLGNDIQSSLIGKTNESSLKESQFPWEVRSVIRFQKEHPEFEGRSITEYAHRISGVTRLMYIEVADFSTRGAAAVQLLRGSMMANVKVIEIADGKSKVVYEKQDLRVAFPERAPEGVLNVSEGAIYAGTVKAMGKQVAELFYPHVIED